MTLENIVEHFGGSVKVFKSKFVEEFCFQISFSKKLYHRSNRFDGQLFSHHSTTQTKFREEK
jgi:hypothetical protein